MRLVKVLLFLVSVAVLLGCGGAFFNAPPQMGSLSFKVTWPVPNSRVIPTASNAIRIIVRDINSTIVANGLIAKPATTWATPTLNPGGYTVTATAVPNTDGSGVVQATGAVAATVVEGQTTNTSLTMGATVTSVTLTAPATSTTVNGTVQVSATCKDSSGNLVLVHPTTLTWSSSQASVASIDSTGLAKGVSDGNTNLTATFTEVEASLGQSPVTSAPLAFSVGPRILYYTVDGSSNTKVYTMGLDGSGETLVESLNNNRYWSYNPFDGLAYIGGEHNGNISSVSRAPLGNFNNSTSYFNTRNNRSSLIGNVNLFSQNKVVFGTWPQAGESGLYLGVFNKQTNTVSYTVGSPWDEFGQWVADDSTMYITGQDTAGGASRTLRRVDLNTMGITVVQTISQGSRMVNTGDLQSQYLFYSLNPTDGFAAHNTVGRTSLTGTNSITWKGTRSLISTNMFADTIRKNLFFISYDSSFADIIRCNYDGTGQTVIKTIPFTNSQLFMFRMF
jgi:hypothetical protein